MQPANHIVDGRNPANHLICGLYLYYFLQGFIHPNGGLEIAGFLVAINSINVELHLVGGWWLITAGMKSSKSSYNTQKPGMLILIFAFFWGHYFILGKNDVPIQVIQFVTFLYPQFRWVCHESNNRRPSDFGSRFALPDPPKRWVAR